jgi:hypothetical protein
MLFYMPLPDAIPVRYAEEEARYVAVRPVVQQTFQIRELAGMVIRVTGKNHARVRQILRAGTVVYNGYRYWWAGFEPDEQQLAAMLATFPEDDPSRPFHGEECVAVFLETGGGAAYRLIEITRAQAKRRRLWRRRSAWGALQPPQHALLSYVGFSHGRAGDLYRRTLTGEEATRLLRELLVLAPRSLRIRLAGVTSLSALAYLCPRRTRAPLR